MGIVDSNMDLRKFNKFGVEFYGYPNIYGSPEWDSEESKYYYIDGNNEKVYVDYTSSYYKYDYTTGRRIYVNSSNDWNYFYVNQQGQAIEIENIEQYLLEHSILNVNSGKKMGFNVTFLSKTITNPSLEEDYNNYDLNWDYSSLEWEELLDGNNNHIGFVANAYISVDVLIKQGKWQFNYPKQWTIYSLNAFHTEDEDYEDCGEWHRYDRLLTIDFKRADEMSDVVSIESIFYNCFMLNSADFSRSTLENVTNADSAFYNCNALSNNSIILNNATTFSKLESADDMFYSDSEIYNEYSENVCGVCGENVASKILALTNNNVFQTSIDDIYLRFINNNIKYKILTDNNSLCISVLNNNYSGNITIPSSVNAISRTLSVVSINNGAFAKCDNLLSVNIQANITEIKESTFNGSKNLLSVTLPNGLLSIDNNAFSNCEALTSLTIPSSVTSIGSYVFENSGLTSVNLPMNIVSVGYSAYYGCYNIATLDIDCSLDLSDTDLCFTKNGIWYKVNEQNKVKVISNPDCETKYSGSITIPNSVVAGDTFTIEAIESNAFYGNDELISVVISNSVENIGSSAFSQCANLVSVTLPNAITSIENYTFSNCAKLSSITIPSSVTSIKTNAFYNCAEINLMSIPSSITSIGNNAFYKVNFLLYNGSAGNASATWGALHRLNIVDGDFGYYDAEKTQLALYMGSGSVVTIPNGVVSIGEKAFYNCSTLTTINKPNTITSIGASAFENCVNLATIDLTDVQSVGNRCFRNCEDLTSLVLTSVRTFGDYAFENCTGFTSIETLYATSIGVNAFKNCTNLATLTLKGSDSGTINSGAFDNCPIETLTYKNDFGKSFDNLSTLKTLYIFGSKDLDRDCHFRNCVNLEYVKISGNIKQIKDGTFDGCIGLKTVIIESNVNYINSSNGSYQGLGYNYSYKKEFVDCPIETLHYDTDAANSVFSGKTTIKHLVIGDNVSNIPNYMFYYNEELTTLAIGKDITIGNDFINPNCPIETLIYNTDAITTQFSGMATLKNLKIGDEVTTIASNAFTNCPIENLECLNGVTDQFRNKTTLKTLAIGNEQYSKYCNMIEFNNNKNIVVADGAFEGCTSLKSVKIATRGNYTITFEPTLDHTISDGSNTIEYYSISTFDGCPIQTFDYYAKETSYKSVYVDDKRVFNNISTIKTLTIGNSVQNQNTFKGCTIESLIVKQGVTLANNSFADSDGYTSIVIEGSVTNLENANICCVKNNKRYKVIDINKMSIVAKTDKYSGDVVIDNSLTIGNTYNVTKIDANAFKNCNGMTSLTIPENIQSIGDTYAFSGCSSLVTLYFNAINCSVYEDVSVLIGSSTRYITISLFADEILRGYKGSGDFYSNTQSGIRTLHIGENVTNGDYLGNYCNRLSSIHTQNNRSFSSWNLEIKKNYVFYKVLDKSTLNVVASEPSNNGSANVVITDNVTTSGNQLNVVMNSAISFKSSNLGITTFFYNFDSITIANSISSIASDALMNFNMVSAIYYSGTATGANWGATNATLYPNNN